MRHISLRNICTILAVASCAIMSPARVTLGFDGEEAASVGIYVKDLSTGEVVAQNDQLKSIIPASILKSVTGAAAMTTLGPDFRFKTPIYLYGSQGSDKSRWDGNLVIESCGDPTIDSDQFKERKPLADEIISALNEKGIKTITGNVIIRQPQPQQGCPTEWEIEDVAWAYGAGWYGFNFFDNSFTLRPSTKVTSPHIPDLNITIIKDNDGTDLVRGINSNDLYVYSSRPNNPKWVTESTMPNPAIVFTSLLTDKMRRAGIEIMGHASSDVSERTLVCEHKSATLCEILRETMHVSHNLFAEGLLRALAPDENRKAAIKADRQALKSIGVKTAYNKIIDGSGLARGNCVQPIFMSQVLEGMARSRYADEYVSTFPVVGKDGTVKRMLAKTDLDGRLALKSGSMNAVQCFAGYKLGPDGKPTHTVVIMVNAFYCERAEVRKSIDDFLLSTFAPAQQNQ